MRRFPGVSAIAVPLVLLILQVGCAAGEPEEADVPVVIDAWAYSTTSAQARAELLRAEHRWDMDDRPRAYERAMAAVALDPLWGYAYLVAAQNAPGFEDFRANLRRAIENSAGATPPERLLIEAAQQAFDGDAEGELEAIEALVALDPENARSHAVLGWALMARNRDAEARQEYTRAIELEPEMAIGYYLLVFSLVQLQLEPLDPADAETNMARLLELEPDEAGIEDLHGDMLRVQGRLPEARDAYARAFELDTTRALMLQQRGNVNTFLGDYDAARADFAAARDRGKNNEPATYARYLAYAYIYEGRPEVALDSLQSLLGQLEGMDLTSLQGQRIATLQDIVIVAAETGEIDAARAALDAWTTEMRARADETGTPEFTAGTNSGIAFWSGIVAAYAGEYEHANEFARHAMEAVVNQRNPRRNELAHGLMGFVALRQGQYAEAVAHLEQADLDNQWFEYQLALALEGAGRRDEAMTRYRKLADVRLNNIAVAFVRNAAQRKVNEASPS